MGLIAFLLAVCGAICWGIAPVFGKLGLRNLSPLDGLFARTLFTIILVTVTFLGMGGNIKDISSIPPRNWLFLFLEAFFATFAGDLAYYAALKYGEISKTALILASAPLVTVLIGWHYLGEEMSLQRIIAAALIIAGVILISIESV